MTAQPEIKVFFDQETFTLSYVVHDPDTRRAAIIDSVLNYDPKAARTSTASAEGILEYVAAQGLTVAWILETHVHADHLTAAPYLQEKLGARTGIGAHVGGVQHTFKTIFNAEDEFPTDGSQFDHLFHDGEAFSIGALEARVLHTPGHTPACITYLIGSNAFIGDTLFSPDYGTARCDFPGGDARQLYQSIQKLFQLPDNTNYFLCHDYMPNGRELLWQTPLTDQRENNIHIHQGVSETEFIAMRTARDKALEAPVLILPAVQVNMRGGHLPPAEENDITYLKIPVNTL